MGSLYRHASFAATLALVLVLPAHVHAADDAAADEGKVKLEIEKPKRAYVGRPFDPPIEIIKVLEKWVKEPLPLMVPKDTRLLSRGKPVTSSARNIVDGSLEQITDGDKEAADQRMVEVGLGVSWVQIDLSRPAIIHAVAVWHDHRDMYIYHDVILQLSDDAEFARGVTTVFNSDHDGSSGLGVGEDKLYVESHHGKVIDAKGVKARYVRLYSNGSTAEDVNHYTEVEVYGTVGD